MLYQAHRVAHEAGKQATVRAELWHRETLVTSHWIRAPGSGKGMKGNLEFPAWMGEDMVLVPRHTGGPLQIYFK